MLRRVAGRIGEVDAAVQRLSVWWFIAITVVAGVAGFVAIAVLMFAGFTALAPTPTSHAAGVALVAIGAVWMTFAFMWMGRRF